MRNMEHALRYLTAVQKKNKVYLAERKLKIVDCVSFAGSGSAITVSITNADLPQSIKDDINYMFWI